MKISCKHCGARDARWRKLVSRWDLETQTGLTLCDTCYRKEASLIARRRATRDALRSSIANHPVSYEDDIPLGGYRSVEIADSHLDDCSCKHCLAMFAHMDDEDDIRGSSHV